MKIFFTFLSFFGLLSFASAQQGFPLYYTFVDKVTEANRLFEEGKYKKAALAYEASALLEVEKGVELPYAELYYTAAAAWVRAGLPDKAFKSLDRMVELHGFIDYDRIAVEAEFIPLHTDKRWFPLLHRIAQQYEHHELRKQNYQRRITLIEPIDEVVFYPHTSHARQFLENDSLPFISLNYRHFRVYFRADSPAATQVASIKTALDMAFARALSVLQTPLYSRGINFILTESPEELQELIGFRVRGGMASIGNDLVFIVYGDGRRGQFTHELFHLMANAVWGITSSRLLNEGSAVYADNTCFYENPVYGIAAYMQQKGLLLPLSTLISEFDAKAAENELVAYLQSAAIFKYLYEKHGVEKMKRLWVENFDRFEAIYGLSIAAFEQEWLAFIRTLSPPEGIDWEMLLREGCG